MPIKMTYRIDKNSGCAAMKFVNWKLQKYDIVLFTKSYCPEGRMCHHWLTDSSTRKEDNYDCVCYEKRGDVSQVDDYLWMLSGKNNRESPHIFIRGEYVGGYRAVLKLMKSGKLRSMLNSLSHFPCVGRKFPPSIECWRQARGPDSKLLPSLVLKVATVDKAGTTVKINRCDPRDHQSVDCSHFGARPHQLLQALPRPSGKTPAAEQVSDMSSTDGQFSSKESQRKSSADTESVSMNSWQRNRYAFTSGLLLAKVHKELSIHLSHESLAADPSDTSGLRDSLMEAQKIRGWAPVKMDGGAGHREDGSQSGSARMSSGNASGGGKAGTEGECGQKPEAQANAGRPTTASRLSKKKERPGSKDGRHK